MPGTAFGRTARVRRARRGFTLIEVAFAITVLLVALMSLSAASLSMHSLRRQNRERAVAQNAVRTVAENVHSVARKEIGQPGSWAQNVVGSLCPHGMLQASFDVPGLNPQDGDAHVGTMTFVADETATDASLGVQLGMPRDLDGDGIVGSTNVLATGRILPVVVRIRWQGVRGNVQIVHPLFVNGY